MEQTIKPQPPVVPEFLSGGGEMGQRIRDFDWSKTPLGPVHTWPQSLQTCVRIMLTSRQPMWIGWGPEWIKLYNDPYKAIVGGKHPQALGQPASVVWKAIWGNLLPLKKMVDRGEGTYSESQLLIMERNGYPEETYYTFSYTPIPGDHGGTEGMICANTDDTDRIIGERQMKTLSTLGKNLANCQSNEEVIEKTIDSLQDNQRDFLYVLFYSIKSDKIILSRSSNLGQYAASVPQCIALTDNDALAVCIKHAIEQRELQVFEQVQQTLGDMPKGAWEVTSNKAIVLPIVQNKSKEPYGILVAGFNPYRLFNEKYHQFFNMVSDQIATSFADVHVLEEERKRAEALAEIDRAKTTFFSNISHEFRTPLTLLLSPIEDLLNDPGISTEQKLLMNVVYRNALRMQKLVNTLLEFSRIEAGRMEGRFVPVDIGMLTEDLASVFRSAIEKANMQLVVHCDTIVGEVYVDPEMWERIMMNLVSNAFKYSKEGTITVAVKQQQHNVVVQVTDTGVGIPPDQLEKIFNRFHRVENTEGRSLEGTGIGLAMVKELVKLHHGTIQVTSEPGKGSTFTITLPIGKDHLPADKIEQAAITTGNYKHSTAFVEEALKWLPAENELAPAAGATAEDNIDTAPLSTPVYKVLLADDNADMRNYVQRLLSNRFEVITAENGEVAFQQALAHRPDLLLCDIMMPKLDGFGVLKKIRNHPDTRNIPVIFLSARAGEEAKVEGLDAGADDYLVKPFSAKELLVRVSNLIHINKVRRETEQQFYQLFAQAPAFINVLKGPDFRVELFHPKNKELLGNIDLTGKTLREALPELEEQGIFKILDEVYNTGKIYKEQERRVKVMNDKGEWVNRYFSVTCQPWYDIKGRIQGILSFAIEQTEAVTSRRKIEDSEKRYRQLSEQLEVIVDRRTEELKRSNDDLQQFAHVASHDLKEPVRKFKTFIGRLQEEYSGLLPAKGQVYLNKMINAAERMSSMIEGVLKYSALNTADQDITMVNLNNVVSNIEADLEVVINQKKAQVSKTNLPSLEGNATLLYQLFYNLINNSLKFSNGHPVIDISCTLVKDHGKECAKIVVADQGIGFDQPEADKIFNAFTRLNSKDKYEGTGLGLALCKKIVERHHGNISAIGETNKGAVFTIVLPLVQDRKLNA